MLTLALVVATSVVATPPATASATPEAAPPPVVAGPTYAPPKAADQKDNQVVCRTEAVLGSRMPVRRCRTVADIKDRTLHDREQVEHDQANLQIRSN